MESAGIGDTAYFGPEAEFFVFDDVRYDVSMNECYYKIDSEEGPYNTGRTQPTVIWVTARPSRAATSRFPRSTRLRICAPRC